MSKKIVVTGAAGLVGQNLLPRLKASGIGKIVAIDKHPTNVEILRKLHPDIQVIAADLAKDGRWVDAFQGCTIWSTATRRSAVSTPRNTSATT